MKYKVGQRVKMKSLDWYNKNKDIHGNIECGDALMNITTSQFCGKIVTISSISDVTDIYKIEEDNGQYIWTDEMIECLVEPIDCKKCGLTYMSTRCLFMDNCPHNQPKNTIEIPKGWILKDENGNVINATKIVLEKKKREYPKTYKECREILKVGKEHTLEGEILRNNDYKIALLVSFQKLLICRDVYWKIAGEEMGLGKPWEPSDSDYITGRYCIFVHRGNILCDTPAQDCILTFPTEEMRDAFKENFDPDIESCKELL